jgi:hypothetical protein
VDVGDLYNSLLNWAHTTGAFFNAIDVHFKIVHEYSPKDARAVVREIGIICKVGHHQLIQDPEDSECRQIGGFGGI